MTAFPAGLVLVCLAGKKEKGTALGELMGWAAAVLNDFEEEDTDNLELRGIEVSDFIVRTGEDEEDAEEEAEAERERVLLQSIGPFTPPAGSVVMDTLPEEIGFPGFLDLCKTTKKFLKNKRVAFKSLGTVGWEQGKVHMQETSVKKGTNGWFSIKVSHVRGYALYDLKKDTYKTD